jgi:hypothetical protein
MALEGTKQTASLSRAQLARMFDREARKKLNKALAAVKKRRDELARATRGQKPKLRAMCRTSKKRARERGKTLIAAAKVEARQAFESSVAKCKATREGLCKRDRKGRAALREEERRLRDEYKRETKRLAAGKSYSTAKERRQESDDAVRANLDPDMVPVFDMVKASIVGTPRMDRTEVFLHWAEENADEVAGMLALRADAALAKEQRAFEAANRAARRVLRKGKVTPRDLHELAIECPDVEELGFVCDEPDDVVAAWETLERERMGYQAEASAAPF